MSAARRDRPRAAIVGVEGCKLATAERRLFERAPPAGFMLFRRNCKARDQIEALIGELRASVARPEAPILIDQEGGRVARLRPPLVIAKPPLRDLGLLAEHDLEKGIEAAWLHGRLTAAALSPLGITVNCAPVLDLALPDQTDAIGDRAFSADPSIVAALGKAMIEGHLAGGVLPVIKHLPGHGRATVDSHLELPKVSTDRKTLRERDFQPFRALADAPLGMTAHILYAAIDSRLPATLSQQVIGEIIRDDIGFGGALLSDDLSMEALGGTLADRAAAALKAGCDLALHCNGDIEEMGAVLDAAGPLEGAAEQRVHAALARRLAPVSFRTPFDVDEGERRLSRLLFSKTLIADREPAAASSPPAAFEA